MYGYLRLFSCNGLLAEAERLVTAVEGNELSLEHGVTVDLETGTLVALHTTEAGCVGLVHSSEGDLVSGDLGHVGVADSDGHVGKGSRARVDETADLSVELSTLYLGVICLGNLLIDEKERCTGVGNGIRALGVLEELVTDSELGGIELPETGLGLDGNPGHLALELGSIDLAKLVHTCAIGVEVGGEDRHVEVAHNIVEEGLRRSLLGAIVDSVEVRESKTNKTIGVGVLNERLRNLVGQLNGLALNLDASDGDGVRTDCSSSTRAVTVADLPLSTLSLLEGSRLGGIEGSVAASSSVLNIQLGIVSD